MNKTTEALKLAEEALDELRYANDTLIAKTKYYKALAAIREALAEQEEQEPVAWAYEYGTDKSDAVNEIRWYPNLTALHKPKPEEGSLIRNVRPLYAAPVSAKMQADCTLAAVLAEREACAQTVETESQDSTRYEFAAAIRARGEK